MTQLTVAFLASCVLSIAVCAPAAYSDNLNGLSGKELTNELIREQIRDLRNNDGSGVDLTAVAAMITAVVGLAALLGTLWKSNNEMSRQRTADRVAAEDAATRRFDAQFANLARELGAEEPATRVGATVGLTRLLSDNYASFHDDVTRLIVANLKIQANTETLDVLRRGLERALGNPPVADTSFDLSRAHVEYIDLAGLVAPSLDLSGAFATFANLTGSELEGLVARGADLEKAGFVRANLQEARLRGANCEGTDFSEANLVSANFKGANLKNTKFYGARLQGALFGGAVLSGTRFEQANLADAHFEGATLAPETYTSILKAVNWRKAHFDGPVLRKLNAPR